MGRRVFTAMLPSVYLPPFESTVSTAPVVSSNLFPDIVSEQYNFDKMLTQDSFCIHIAANLSIPNLTEFGKILLKIQSFMVHDFERSPVITIFGSVINRVTA